MVTARDPAGVLSVPSPFQDHPEAKRMVALPKRLKLSRRKFADRFGLDVRGQCRAGNRAAAFPTGRRACC